MPAVIWCNHLQVDHSLGSISNWITCPSLHTSQSAINIQHVNSLRQPYNFYSSSQLSNYRTKELRLQLQWFHPFNNHEIQEIQSYDLIVSGGRSLNLSYMPSYTQPQHYKNSRTGNQPILFYTDLIPTCTVTYVWTVLLRGIRISHNFCHLN